MKVCATCGTDLTGSHGRRKFCSERCRKAQYDLVCSVCGGRADGTTPSRRRHPVYCRKCRVVGDTKWTRETVVAAIRLFVSRYGRQPRAADFHPNVARKLGHEWRAERFYRDGDYPSAPSVQYVFESWNAAIEAAGMTPGSVGKYPRDHRKGARHRGAHLDAERSAA